jgi:3-oxoacyl-[acyl-carrier protein] reductase
MSWAPDAFAGLGVLVTGAAGGMGLETARQFARHGARVLLADLDPAVSAGAAALSDAGLKAAALRLDVADPASVAAAFGAADAQLPRLDVLVTCAAIITSKRIAEMDLAHWRRVLDVNLVGTFLCVQQAVARMVPRGAGSIVCVASDAGVKGGGGLIADAAYAATKAGVLNLVKSVAREIAGSGVRINALNPGPSDTPMHKAVSAELKARIAAGLPIKRMGTPADMAGAILFLCSPAASFVYGAALDADGGSMFR